MSHWYQLEAAQVVEALDTNASTGLSHQDVMHRRSQQGSNKLVESALKSPWLMLWEQLTGATMLLLLVAAIVSIALGDYKDTAAILAIVVLNALIGVNQEYRAGKAIAALKKLAVPTVRVCRDGQWQEISAHELVPGDLVNLVAGNLVPADCRLLESSSLRVQESTFTGESEPVEKVAYGLTQGALALSDRRNMLYMGTVITYGRGQAVVTETGMQTELGNIARLVQEAEQELTPLQHRLEKLGQKLVIATLGVVVVIFGLGLLRGESVQLMFLTAVSVAVAVVPEGLPAIVTIVLAIGSKRMLAKQALIRKLPAVETLGSVSVICADKTGTLTENCMTVTVLEVIGQRLDLEPSAQRFTSQSRPASLEPSLRALLTGCALCNDALLLSHATQTEQAHVLGDPTEAALIVVADRLGFAKAILEQSLPRIGEIPFDATRKCMTTIHQVMPSQTNEFNDRAHSLFIPTPVRLSAHVEAHVEAHTPHPTPYLAFTKGAVGSLLDRSSHLWVDDHAEPLQDDWRDRILASNSELAATGTRVLGVACRWLESVPVGQARVVEQNLVFIGLVGMLDPTRVEVKQAVETCKTAGIRPVMITGDHPLIGRHIAAQLGILTHDRVLTGVELDQLTPDAFANEVEAVSVYARVSPEQKLKIIQALQARGQIVAMTGDGINDAPALRKADIGIAMGRSGTDVAKEAADMVLLDDNFATIVAAVAEGRVLYDNIRKFIKYSITGNASGVWVMLLAPFLGMPLPLLPIQILWINLLADGVLALALSVEPAERDTMQRSPYSPTENVFSRGVGRDIIWVGLVLGLVIVAIGYWYWSTAQTSWQTLVFSVLAFSRMSLALAVRSDRDSLISNWPFLKQTASGCGRAHIFGTVSGDLCPSATGTVSNDRIDLARVGRGSGGKYGSVLGDRASKMVHSS